MNSHFLFSMDAVVSIMELGVDSIPFLHKLHFHVSEKSHIIGLAEEMKGNFMRFMWDF